MAISKSSKPSRDPKKRATAFEAASFPFLVDRIIAHAPVESLLQLRLSCRAWKDAADVQRVRHVVVNRPSPFMQGSLTTPIGNINIKQWYRTPLVRSVKVVDLWGSTAPAWLARCRNVALFRHGGSGGSRSDEVIYTIRPEGKVKITRAAYYYPPAVSSTSSTYVESMSVSDRGEHVVVAMGTHMRFAAEYPFVQLPKSLTIIIHRPTRDGWSAACVVHRVFWVYVLLLKLFRRMGPSGEPVALTIVNLEELYRMPPGNETSCTSCTSCSFLKEQYFISTEPGRFLEGLQQRVDVVEDEELVPLASKTISGVQLRSVDEYIDMVGQEAFNTETELIGTLDVKPADSEDTGPKG